MPLTLITPTLHLSLLSGTPYSVRGASAGHSLGIAMERQRGVHAIATDRRSDFDTWPGTLAYTPPGMDVFSESAQGGEYLLLQWRDGEFAAGCAPQPASAWPAAPAQTARLLASGQQHALKIATEIRRLLHVREVEPLALEALAVQLADAGERALGRGAPPGRGRPAAPLRQYAPVLDHIEAHLDCALTLHGMASVLAMPELPFLREFRRALGVTPHAYVTGQRLHRARRLLRTTDLPLVEIAMACGFSHQSHMGTYFQREFGLSPRDYGRRYGRVGQV